MPVDEKLSLLNTVTIGKTQGKRIARENGKNHFQIGRCSFLNSNAF
jgi:serine acetyltransferase